MPDAVTSYVIPSRLLPPYLVASLPPPALSVAVAVAVLCRVVLFSNETPHHCHYGLTILVRENFARRQSLRGCPNQEKLPLLTCLHGPFSCTSLHAHSACMWYLYSRPFRVKAGPPAVRATDVKQERRTGGHTPLDTGLVGVCPRDVSCYPDSIVSCSLGGWFGYGKPRPADSVAPRGESFCPPPPLPPLPVFKQYHCLCLGKDVGGLRSFVSERLKFPLNQCLSPAVTGIKAYVCMYVCMSTACTREYRGIPHVCPTDAIGLMAASQGTGTDAWCSPAS